MSAQEAAYRLLSMPMKKLTREVVTLAAKRRRKGMVIILCVCSQNSGKTTNISGSNELLADLKLYKDQK